jgi:chorismate mutase
MKMNDELGGWRRQIDTLDEELLHILAKRVGVVREIGRYKSLNGIAPLDEKRWREVIESRLSKARVLKISEVFTMKLFNLIHEQALEIESENK